MFNARNLSMGKLKKMVTYKYTISGTFSVHLRWLSRSSACFRGDRHRVGPHLKPFKEELISSLLGLQLSEDSPTNSSSVSWLG